MTDLLCYDPGLSTGWAWFRSLDGGPYALYDHGVIVGGCEGFIRDTGLRTGQTIVSESFIPYGVALGDDGVHSLQIEGALKQLVDLIGGYLVFQPPSDKAVLAKSEKARNRWITQRFGKIPTQHAKDAITHGLVWMKRNHRPSLAHYWPADDEGPAQ